MTDVQPLVPYPLRKIWPDEARNFTPWLAEASNLTRLGGALGIGSLEFEKREFTVGPFSLDILARDPFGNRVVIENQLEPSDHDHLGKALTYLAGSGGGLAVVWIAAEIRGPHRAALNWLNAHTPPQMHFFGVEVSAWTINGSEPGTHFQVVVRPDNVRRTGRRIAGQGALTDEQIGLQVYWSAFRDFLVAHEAQHWVRSELPRSGWWGRNLGRPGCNLYAVVKPKVATIGILLEIEGHNEAVQALSLEQAALEAAIGEPLKWTRAAVRHQISVERTGVSINDELSWPEQHAWLLARMERFRITFKDRIAAFPEATDAEPTEEPEAIE